VNQIAAMTSSVKHDWETPEKILGVVRSVLGPIYLDPCTSLSNPVGAERFYVPKDDGLSKQWRGTVYMNSPYGRELSKWVKKASAEEGATAIIGLIPARPDTRWFQDYCNPSTSSATAVCFWRGRLTFVGAPAPALFPSALVLWTGDRRITRLFCDVTSKYGAVWR
jgi:hypothetical protein